MKDQLQNTISNYVNDLQEDDSYMDLLNFLNEVETDNGSFVRGDIKNFMLRESPTLHLFLRTTLTNEDLAESYSLLIKISDNNTIVRVR